MFSGFRSERGFSLNELMLVVAFAATLMAMALPVLNDITESTKLNTASREIERELQGARLKAVSVNRVLRVRLNCPSAGYFRTVEVIGTSADSTSNRCLLTAYPFPSADTELTTRPNYDGPMKVLPRGAVVGDAVVEFRPDGTVYNVVSNTPQAIGTDLTVTITRNGKARTVTVNGAGRIRLQ